MPGNRGDTKGESAVCFLTLEVSNTRSYRVQFFSLLNSNYIFKWMCKTLSVTVFKPQCLKVYMGQGGAFLRGRTEPGRETGDSGEGKKTLMKGLEH